MIWHLSAPSGRYLPLGAATDVRFQASGFVCKQGCRGAGGVYLDDPTDPKRSVAASFQRHSQGSSGSGYTVADRKTSNAARDTSPVAPTTSPPIPPNFAREICRAPRATRGTTRMAGGARKALVARRNGSGASKATTTAGVRCGPESARTNGPEEERGSAGPPNASGKSNAHPAPTSPANKASAAR